MNKEQRAALVEDRYQSTDSVTNVTSVFRRVSYYDPLRQFNGYVTQQKVGVIDPATGEVVPVKSKKGNFKRRDINAAVSDTFAQTTEGLTDERQEGKILYGLSPTMEILLGCAMGGDFGPKNAANYWEKHIEFFLKRWGAELPKSAPSISTVN